MFSTRTPADLKPNRLALALQTVRAQGLPIVDLTESNPTCAGFDYPQDLLRLLADPCGLVYRPSSLGSTEARTAVAREYARRGTDIQPEHIALTASTSEAYGFLFKVLAEAGDEVLVPRPSYPLFEHLARLDLVSARPYDLDIDAGWRIDFDSIDAALTARTRAILVVSPNNPTGSFVRAGEMNRLATLCADRGMALIADEVFADFELMPGSSADAGRVLDQRDVLAFSLGGLSKSVGLPQAKLAWMAVGGPAGLVGSALERLELVCDTYLTVSTPVQAAAGELLERGSSVRDQIGRRVSSNYQRLREWTTSVPACRVLPCDGGWHAVLQVPSLASEDALVVDLLLNDGVLTHPGYFFDFPRESYLIISLLVHEEQFAAGVDRILRHVDRRVGRHG